MKKLTFYIDKFCIINNKTQIDLKDFSAIKRRLSLCDQASISSINEIFSDNVKEIVFASEYGEVERLDKIIDEYKENNEVSPIKFSGSVHNYAVGCFNLTKQINIPYHAISAGENTISSALLQCIIKKSSPVLMCCADNFQNNLKCISCLISKDKMSENSFKCEFEKTGTDEKTDEYKDFCNFLTNETNVFQSNLGTIRKV